MGNLQVQFLEGWAPAMAPGYSTRFSMVGVILSQKMYPILCPPYRHTRTVVHSQPHPTVSTKLLFFSSNAENGGFVLDGPPALGAGGPEFESRRPDQSMVFVSHHFETTAFLP